MLMNKRIYLVIVGIVAVAVLLSILFYTMLANHQPTIISLGARQQGVLPLESCQITCHATDPDGDGLSYNWLASGGGIVGEGATVTWTAPLSAGSYNVTVIVIDGRGGEVTDYITIVVSASTIPIITSLVADADWTAPLSSLQVACNATDPDGDEISYEWSTTGGGISGTGSAVKWIAPEEVGIYEITVVVTDSQGANATRSITLIASNGPPPTIENLIVTAKGHKYLRASMWGYDYDVWKTKEYDIECIASNTTGGVFYEWACTGGNISGDGSMITWTAPNQSPVDVTVTAIVSDVDGNKMGKSIVLYVPYCACGF
jgi:hypothetical protein